MERKRHLGSYFRVLSNALAMDMRHTTEALGLTPTQGMFLHHLWYLEEIEHRPAYAKDLEKFFDIRHPTVSGILQRMESAGFLTLRESRDDRRFKQICLTEKAKDAHEQIKQQIEATEQRILEGFTPEEAGSFRRFLEQAAKNLNACSPCCRKLEKEEETP